MFDLPPTPDALLRGIVLSSIGLAWVIILVRLVGTRTLSKMTAFDFLVTLATGSLLATAGASTSWPAFMQALAGITALIGAQYALAIIRRRSRRITRLIENEPLLLVCHGRFLEEALRHARVSKAEIIAKLREANIAGLDKVTAVVLETTGDISIMTADTVTEEVMAHVRNQSGKV